MTRFDDYENEMPTSRPLDDATMERLFAGTPVEDDDLLALAAFVADLRTAAVTSAPPQPSAALAAVLAGGLKTIDAGDAALGAGSAPRRLVPRLACRRNRVLRCPGSGLAARLAAAGLVTKVAFGATMAAASVAAAGTAGVLPDPVQHAVAGVVRAVTPFEFPDPAGKGRDVGGGSDADTEDGNLELAPTVDTAPASDELRSDPPQQPTTGTAPPNFGSPDGTEPDTTVGDPPGTVPGETPPAGESPRAGTPTTSPTTPATSPPQTSRTTPPATAPDGQLGTVPTQPGDVPSGEPEEMPGEAPTTPPASQPVTTSTTQPTQEPSGRR